MTSIRPERGIELIAVFPDASEAARAARDLERDGLHPTVEREFAVATRGEMEEELDHTWWAGGLGVFATDEMTQPAVGLGVALGAVGALVGAVLTATIASGPGDWWARALLGAVVGAIFLGTVGGIVGGGMGARHPDEDLPVTSGAALRVPDRDPGTADALARRHPVRIDRFRDGQYVETLAGDTPSAPRRLGEGLADPQRR